MNNSSRKAMWAKIKPQQKMGIKAYTRDEINQRITTFGKQGTTKFLGSRCMHCGGTDATFKHKRGNGTISEVRCIRCKTNAGM